MWNENNPMIKQMKKHLNKRRLWDIFKYRTKLYFKPLKSKWTWIIVIETVILGIIVEGLR